MGTTGPSTRQEHALDGALFLLRIGASLEQSVCTCQAVTSKKWDAIFLCSEGVYFVLFQEPWRLKEITHIS